MLLPNMKELDYVFTGEDLVNFFQSRELLNLKTLSPKELKNMSGGVWPALVAGLGFLIIYGKL